MIVYLHPNDARYAGRTFSRHIGMDVRHVILPEEIALEDVAGAVVASFEEDERSAPEGTVDSLVIFAEGGPGWICLTASDGDEENITKANAAKFAGPFAKLLKPSNRNGQGVEIHGCGPAAAAVDQFDGELEDADAGLRFLYELAAEFGCRVLASADPDLSEFDEAYTDSLVEAQPDDDDPDWEGHVRILRDAVFERGSALSSRVEATEQRPESTFSEVERSYFPRPEPR